MLPDMVDREVLELLWQSLKHHYHILEVQFSTGTVERISKSTGPTQKCLETPSAGQIRK